MRMRKKKNLLPRMEKAGAVLFDAEGREGLTGEDIFGKQAPLMLEIGCGKGRFLCEKAKAFPDALFIGVERIADVIVLAMERAVREEIPNIRFVSLDAADLLNHFALGCAAGIFLNFSDPWPKPRHRARRLDGPEFLKIYRALLAPDGVFEMKTDNDEFFEYGEQCLREAGWRIVDLTRDLTAEHRPENIVTEYEERWSSQGILINYLKALPPGSE